MNGRRKGASSFCGKRWGDCWSRYRDVCFLILEMGERMGKLLEVI